MNSNLDAGIAALTVVVAALAALTVVWVAYLRGKLVPPRDFPRAAPPQISPPDARELPEIPAFGPPEVVYWSPQDHGVGMCHNLHGCPDPVIRKGDTVWRFQLSTGPVILFCYHCASTSRAVQQAVRQVVR